MEVRIDKGRTIINTGRKAGEVINKTGIKGLTYYPAENRYRLNVVYNYKKYALSFCHSLEEARKQREEVDKHLAKGDFLEWWQSLPKHQYQKLSKPKKARYQK